MNNYRSFAHAKWSVLFALILCYLFIYCGRQNFGFAMLGIQDTLNLNSTDTGIISAGMLFCYGLGQAINGNLADKFSARKLLTFGLLLSVVFNLITSFATGFWGLMVPWCFNGYVQSLGFTSGSKIISNWWDQKDRGKAFGLFLAASGLSSVVAFMVSIMVLHYFSWLWLFRLPVILIFISTLIFYIIARDHPQELGFSPNLPIVQPNMSMRSKERYYHVFSNYHFQLSSLSMGFCSVARYGLLLWLPLIYLGNSNDPIITIALPLGMALGCIASGTISDKLFHTNRIKPVILFMLIGAALTTILYFIPTNHIMVSLVLLFLTGFFIYGPQAPLFALCPDLLGAGCTATGIGIMNAYAYLFSAIGEALIGYSIQVTHQTAIVYMIVTGACLLSAFAAMMVNMGHQPEALEQ